MRFKRIFTDTILLNVERRGELRSRGRGDTETKFEGVLVGF
jgi:hypothetical protein